MARKLPVLDERIEALEIALRSVAHGRFVVLEKHFERGAVITIRPQNPVQREQGFKIAGAADYYLHVEETYEVQGAEVQFVGYRYGVRKETDDGVREILLFHYHPRSEKSKTRWTKQPHMHLKVYEPFQRLHVPTLGPVNNGDELPTGLAIEFCDWVAEELVEALVAV